MHATNTIVLNTEAGFDTEIVLSNDLSIDAATALVEFNGELVLMRAYPLCDPTDRLLPESVIAAAAEYAVAKRLPMKVWAVGEYSVKEGIVKLGKTVVGELVNNEVKLYDIQDMIKRCFH